LFQKASLFQKIHALNPVILAICLMLIVVSVYLQVGTLRLKHTVIAFHQETIQIQARQIALLEQALDSLRAKSGR
jgi:cell division protein FtsL